MLRRRIVDFSAERSFAQTAQALLEHYSIEVPRYSIDKVTGQVCREAKAHNSNKPQRVTAAKVLISEVDGSMLPIINTDPPKGAANKDRRKHRKCHWKELRVSTVSNPDLADTHLPGGCAPLTPGYVLAVPPGRRENAGKHFSQMPVRSGIPSATSRSSPPPTSSPAPAAPALRH